MRVLLIPELYPTRENPVAGIFINDQIQAIKSFADVSVLNLNPFYRGEYIQEEGVAYFDFHLFNKKPSSLLKPFLYKFWENQALKLSLKIKDINLIHIHGSALRGNIALKLSKHLNVPLVCTEHTGPWSAISSRPRVFRRAKEVLERADAVLPVSQHLKKEILDSGIGMREVHVLGNPVDDFTFTLREGKLQSQKRILFVGRLDEFKGAMRVLKAFHSVSDSHSDWNLQIIGSGPEEIEIKKYISTHNLSSRVEFENSDYDRSQLNKLFHQASFLVFPSRFESFGLVAAEAMATGLPVLCTNKTGPLDYCTEPNSMLVAPDSLEDLSEGMIAMIENLDSFKPEEVRASITTRFGMHVYADKLKSLYGRLI